MDNNGIYASIIYKPMNRSNTLLGIEQTKVNTAEYGWLGHAFPFYYTFLIKGSKCYWVR